MQNSTYYSQVINKLIMIKKMSDNKTDKNFQNEREYEHKEEFEKEDDLEDTLFDIIYTLPFDRNQFIQLLNDIDCPSDLFHWLVQHWEYYIDEEENKGYSISDQVKRDIIYILLSTLAKWKNVITLTDIDTLRQLLEYQPSKILRHAEHALDQWIMKQRNSKYADFIQSRNYIKNLYEGTPEYQALFNYTQGNVYNYKSKWLDALFQQIPRTKSINFVFRGIGGNLDDLILSGFEYQSTTYDLNIAINYARNANNSDYDSGNDYNSDNDYNNDEEMATDNKEYMETDSENLNIDNIETSENFNKDGYVLIIRIFPNTPIIDVYHATPFQHHKEILLHGGYFKLVEDVQQIQEFEQQLQYFGYNTICNPLPSNVVYVDYYYF